jgi:hypothetical protein
MDGDRASYTFYGTERAGDDYHQPAFPGVWYLHHASTFDGGHTWATTNITPNDPVQRGAIVSTRGTYAPETIAHFK